MTTTPVTNDHPSDDMSEPHNRARIVVGVDGSAPSRLALRWARFLAEASNAGIEAIQAWDYPTSAFGWAAFPPEWDPATEAEKVLAETVDAVFTEGRPADLQLAVRQGHAAKVLLDAAAGAELLVLGSRGHGGFMGMLLGSVSAGCAELSPCPVLVVHGDEPPPAGQGLM